MHPLLPLTHIHVFSFSYSSTGVLGNASITHRRLGADMLFPHMANIAASPKSPCQAAPNFYILVTQHALIFYVSSQYSGFLFSNQQRSNFGIHQQYILHQTGSPSLCCAGLWMRRADFAHTFLSSYSNFEIALGLLSNIISLLLIVTCCWN